MKTTLEQLQERTEAARIAQADETRRKNEEAARQQRLQAEEDFQKGAAAGREFFEVLKEWIMKVADNGKDCCRIKTGPDATSNYGRGWHEAADPLVQSLGTNFEFFQVWHELFNPDNGKEDGGYYDYGIAIWWGSHKPSTTQPCYGSNWDD